MENQRVRLTKRLLKESLIAALQHKPMERVSVKELCERAELNRSTFYLHYADQYALLTDIEDELLLQTSAHLKDVGPDADTRQYIAAFLRYVQQNGELFHTLLCQPNRESFRQRFIAESLQSVRAGIVFDAEEPARKYVYTFLLSGSLSVIRAWVEAGFDLPEKQVAELIFRLSDDALKAYR